jgi:hypothetical protein
MASLIRRAWDLHIIDDARYKSLNVQLSAAGYKRREPDFDVFPERPTMVKQLMDIHLKDLKYSMEELAKFLCLSNEEMRSVYQFYSGKTLKIVR